MTDFCKTLMNNGFLIYECDEKFVLQKIATPLNPITSITDEIKDNTSYKKFDTYDQAIEAAKVLLSDSFDPSWLVRLMCKHVSGPKIIDLGEIHFLKYDMAIEEAGVMAYDYIKKSYEEGDVENWEVRIRPLR